MFRLSRALRPFPTTILAALAACGGGSDGGTTTPPPPPPPPTPAIALSLSASATTLQAGSNTTFTAILARTNFTGAVTVSVGGAPTGVTSNVTNSGDTYTIALTTVATAAAGAYPLTVTASGSGVGNATATYTLTLTAPPAASYTLAVTPATLSLQQGATGQATVNITRVNFTGAVGLAVTGAPAGVTPTLGSASVTGDNTTLAVAVAASTAAGTYTLTVTGTATGQTNRTATLALTVTQAASGSIAITAGNNTIQQGANGSLNVFVTRTNYTGAVTLVATGMPTGVTTTYTQPGTGTSGQVTFAVGAATPVGSYPITVTASGAGIANATATGTLTVTAGSTGGGNVTLQFCGTGADLPIWVAGQNGAGAWTQLTAGANNTYSFNVTSLGGVAWVRQDAADNYQLFISYGAPAELSARGNCATVPTTPTGRTLTGTVAGIGATDQVALSFGGAMPSPAPSFVAPNFTINNAPTGARDLFGTRSAINLTNATISVNKLFLRRNVNPAGNTLGTIDFNGADAFDPDSRTLTINGSVAGEQVGATVSYVTSNGASALLGILLGSGSALPYAGMPSARTQSGDFHVLTASATQLSGSTLVSLRSVATAQRDATNLTATLPAVLNTPTVTSAGTAYARLKFAQARQSDYASFFSANGVQASPMSPRTVNISMSGSYAGSASTINLEVPDFSGVAGWQNTWGPRVGTQVNWFMTAFGWAIGDGANVEGQISRFGQRSGNFTP